MWNNFFGLEMGRRAMDYFRRGMETAAHNISNADVEGFSRQRVEPSTTDPFTNPAFNRPNIPGQIGTGVQIDAIVRLRDAFLDIQYRKEMTDKGYWEQIQKVLSTVEAYVNEPGGEGLQVALDDYWSGLQELSKRPDDSAVRENLVEKTKNLTVYLDQIVRNYDEFRADLNRDIKLMVEEINTLIDQIASLNTTIKQVQGVGGNPNDLMDKRDLLVDKLSKLIDIDVNPPCLEGDGDFKIDLHGKLLVQGDRTRHLVAVPVPGNTGFFDVQVEDNLFDMVSNPSVLFATVEQSAPEGVHSVNVHRLASESAWSVGYGESTCPDRVKPEAVTDPLNLRGAFSIQVGSQGTRVASSVKPSDKALGEGLPGDKHIFRISVGSFEQEITVEWNDSSSVWDLSDGTATASSAGPDLTMAELEAFLSSSLMSEMDVTLNAVSASESQLVLSSSLHHLVSVTDVKGSLASALGLANDAPVITIDVVEEDTLETIKNKINAMYSSENGLTRPEDWLHASIKLDGATNTYYLSLESNVAGEASRINILGDENGSLQIAKRLGFLNEDGSTNYLEQARDAAFTFDGRLYLSESNTVRDARQVPILNDYSAKTVAEVSPGIRLELRSVGEADITVRHHIKGGALRGALEGRDDIILGFMNAFDELAYGLATEMNALHYAGHGIGDNISTTGYAFFDPIMVQSGASRMLGLSRAIQEDRSLIAAATGDGHGFSNGSGDGSNALRMAQLKQSKVLQSRSADFNEFYQSFIASLGAQGDRANTMLKNQNTLIDQINNQRQSVMGVNIDEEMMNIIKFQQAFNAIARYITTVDEMLDRIINGMGIVGR
ncbi:MAG: flagellar hook-associated protein FlgK [Aminivibrio sp.]|jgi:flagellar hook-associated protein 1 FlgK